MPTISKVGVLMNSSPRWRGLDRLAKQVAASGITKISGDVIIDDRLFKPFRVPNGICSLPPSSSTTTSSMLLLLPTKPGERAKIEWRPKTAAFTVTKDVMTVAAGQKD